MASRAKPDFHKLRFKEIVDKFALQISDDEKERLVHLYDLPPIYYAKSRVQVFCALRMLGIYDYTHPEGLLSIGEVLQRNDLVAQFQEEIKEVRKHRKLRKHSTAVDLAEIYSNVELPPTLDVAQDHIEVLKANVKLLGKIANYRYKDDQNRRKRIKNQLDNAWQKLTDVSDCLSLAGDEAEGCDDPPRNAPEILKEGVPETQPPAIRAVDILASQKRSATPDSSDLTAQYQNIGARMGRRGSDPSKASNTPAQSERGTETKANPQIPKRKDSLPFKKSGLPVAQSKLPHNLYHKQLSVDYSQSTETETAIGRLEVPKRRQPPVPKPKPTRTDSGSASTAVKSADCSGDSGIGDDTWPKPQVFTAELEKRLNMYQSLVHTPHNPEENEYSEPFSTKQPHSKP